MVWARVLRGRLRELPTLAREPHLLEVISFASLIDLRVGGRSRTNVVLVTALVCAVVDSYSHRVLNRFVELLDRLTVAFLRRQWARR